MSVIYGIYGASGYGKEVYQLLKSQLKSNDDEIVFVDDGSNLDSLFESRVIKYKEFLSLSSKKLFIVIAIANGKIREKLTDKCLNDGIKLFNIKANNVICLTKVKIDDGYILNPFVTLTSDIKIGKSFQANLYSYVAHDCVIGDYVTFAPSVKCNGNVFIDDYAYIGTGAIIKQGKNNKPLKIGKGAIVQAGSFVTKNVPDGMTVFGNPAVELTKENLKRRA
jgi:sugar O-acyltransferase (sialic acid O-acetyltransferase NeuD family)